MKPMLAILIAPLFLAASACGADQPDNRSSAEATTTVSGGDVRQRRPRRPIR